MSESGVRHYEALGQQAGIALHPLIRREITPFFAANQAYDVAVPIQESDEAVADASLRCQNMLLAVGRFVARWTAHNNPELQIRARPPRIDACRDAVALNLIPEGRLSSGHLTAVSIEPTNPAEISQKTISGASKVFQRRFKLHADGFLREMIFLTTSATVTGLKSMRSLRGVTRSLVVVTRSVDVHGQPYIAYLGCRYDENKTFGTKRSAEHPVVEGRTVVPVLLSRSPGDTYIHKKPPKPHKG